MRARGLPGGLFRGQVRRGAQHGLGPGGAAAVSAGDAEVQHLDLAARGQHDVGGLDVAVHQADRVGDVQRLADRCGDADGFAGRERPGLVQDLPQGRAGDQLHHDERHRLVDAAVEYGNQMGVAEPGCVPGLPLEPGQEPGIGCVLRAEHLHRHITAEHLIPGPPDRGHAASAEYLLQRVPAAEDPRARHRHSSVPRHPQSSLRILMTIEAATRTGSTFRASGPILPAHPNRTGTLAGGRAGSAKPVRRSCYPQMRRSDLLL